MTHHVGTSAAASALPGPRSGYWLVLSVLATAVRHGDGYCPVGDLLSGYCFVLLSTASSAQSESGRC